MHIFEVASTPGSVKW